MSGRSFLDVRDTDMLRCFLDSCQKWVEANEDNFRAALKLSPSDELSIKMMFENQECWLYEPVRRVRFALVQQIESNEALEEAQ